MASTTATSIMKAGPLMTTLRKWGFTMTGYQKIGLYSHDTLMETPDVLEAIRRMPPQQFDERQWRITRAFLLDTQKRILPKAEWTTFEDDEVNGRYLRSSIDQVVFERLEKENWDSK